MGSKWHETTLGNVIELQRGYDLPSKLRRPGSYPVVSSSGTTDKHAEFKVHGPGVVTGRYGTIGQVFYVTSDYWPLNTTLYVKDFKGNDPRFISYFLRTIDFSSYSGKSAVPGVNRNHLHRAAVRVPPLAAQRRIASILGHLDDKIELNRRMSETLEKMAAALFKSWFVDFDPVHARAEGRNTGLPDDVTTLFPSEFEDSELGEIPKGWRVVPIGDAVRCVGGATPSTKESAFWSDGKHPFVTPKDLAGLRSTVILDSGRHITDAGVRKISSGALPAGSVILSSRAPIGYLGIAEVSVSINQGIIAMCCDGLLPNLYVLQWLLSNMPDIKHRAGGTTFPEISKKNFRPIPALVPDGGIMREFVGRAQRLRDLLVLNEREINSLTAARDALLPELLSGRIAIPEAEEQTDAALA